MKKSLHMFRSFWLLLLILLVLTASALAAAAPTSWVNDGAGLLSKQEATDLDARLQGLEKKYNVHVMVFTAKDLQGAKAGTVANKLSDQIKAGAKGGAMVLVLDMKSRDWYIATDNTMRQKITDDAGIDYLSKDMVTKLSDGKYADAFNTFVNTTDEMLAYYDKEGQPYDPNAEFNVLAAIAAVVLGIGVFFIIRYILKGTMSNVTTAAEADAYLNQDSFDLTRNQDLFLYTDVTRKKKEKKRSSTSSRDSSHGGGGGKF